MNKTILASLATVLFFSTPAFAQTAELSASVPSTREQRRFSLAAVTNVFGGFTMVGAQAQYQLADRFAVGAQLTLGVPLADAGLGGRFFLNAEPKSGLYLDLSAHALTGMGVHALGGVAELGYQYRARSGFLFEAGGGLAVMNFGQDSCGCGPPTLTKESPWHPVPQLTLRFGYAF
jgi:hypothetical protein